MAAGALLDMFPQDLLEHSNKVRPVNVKIIEHDGYIDYEIEFVELEADMGAMFKMCKMESAIFRDILLLESDYWCFHTLNIQRQ